MRARFVDRTPLRYGESCAAKRPGFYAWTTFSEIWSNHRVSSNHLHDPKIDLSAPIEALIFDLDGLLVDSEPLAEIAMEEFLRRYGHARREEVMGKLLGRRLPEA